MSEWICVKDRLPENNSYILVRIKILFGEMKVSLYYEDDFFLLDGNTNNKCITTWVTHWQLLPEPPEE